MTGIDVGIITHYLMEIVTFDYLILNRDRDLSNIEFICNEKNQWKLSPLFDFGQSFLSKDGIRSKSDIEREIRKFKNRPFSSNPTKNIINIEYAKMIAYNWSKNIELIGYDNINCNSFHKQLFKYQLNKLMEL